MKFLVCLRKPTAVKLFVESVRGIITSVHSATIVDVLPHATQNLLNKSVAKLKAKFPTPQCKWYGKVEKVTEHLQQCPDATVTCQQCGTKVLRKLQFKHCPLQITNCLYCRKEGYAKDIIIHEEKECPYRKVECPYQCGNLDIFHDKLDIPVQQLCPLRPVACIRCNK